MPEPDTPVFVLGCHRSGTSVVAGLLHEACGVPMGELMPATADNPMGYFEAQGVVDAHRNLLAQMERDWTCPPAAFHPERFDLSALRHEVAVHRALGRVWAVKDPRSMFMLPAWAHLGVDRARLVAVVRAPVDTAGSIERRDGIRQDRAEAIVDAYLSRLAEIAHATAMPVIRFSADGADLISQVRALAGALHLDWDDAAAVQLFEADLVRHQSPHRDTTPAYELLLERAMPLDHRPVPPTSLAELDLSSQPEQPLARHLGVRAGYQQNELWEIAAFTADDPDVVELVLDGARRGRPTRAGGVKVERIEIERPQMAGSALRTRLVRPSGVVAHGLLAGRPDDEIDYFFRSVYAASGLTCDLIVDVPAPTDALLEGVVPPPDRQPDATRVERIADDVGWDHRVTQRLSPGRVGMVFRKRIESGQDLAPLVERLTSELDRCDGIEAELSRLRREISAGGPEDSTLAEARRRAAAAEHELERLRSRRSVRIALTVARPFGGIFRTVRTWRRAR